MTADGENTAITGQAQGTFVLSGGTPVQPPSPTAHGVVVPLTPAQATAGPRTSATYVVQVTNVGSADDTSAWP